MANSKFLTFSETDASTHISKCLAYFFDDDGRNRYKFSDAYIKYSKIADESFLTTKRLFNIVRSTNLISDQMLFRQQTTSGFLYFIDKNYFKLVERHHRRISRQRNIRTSRNTSPVEEFKDNDNVSTSSKSTVLDIPSTTIPTESPQVNDPSIGSLSIGDTWEDTKNKSTGNAPVSIQSPHAASPPTKDVVSQSVTNIAEQMDQDIQETLQDIQTPSKDYTSDLQTNIKQFIQSEINAQLQFSLQDSTSYLHIDTLTQSRAIIDKHEEEYKESAAKIRGRMEWVNANMASYERKFQQRYDDDLQMLIRKHTDFLTKKQSDFNDYVDDMKSSTDSKIALLTHDTDKLSDQIKQSRFNVTNMNNSLLPSADVLKNITSQMKTLLKQYQDKVTILDSTIDVLHEELDSIKSDVQDEFKKNATDFLTSFKKNLQSDTPTKGTHPVTPQQPSRQSNVFQNKWPTSIDKDLPHDSDTDTYGYIPSSHRHKQFSTTERPTTPYQGVRTDIIRKNIKISCQDETQLLDFYIKLRTAMIQGGIFLREINDIHEDEEIYEERDGLTSADYIVQTNALYSFLCNEDVIPQEFIFAQNCIKSFSSTMDGFQTLKRMLVLVHPLLNNRRPPSEPPLYSNSGDLHIYEQELRNFYLLHKIYGRSEYTELDKTKQFLEGLDGDEYEMERTRLTAIIDAVELNNSPLLMKHRINSLASTLVNMKNKNTSSKVQINAFTGQRTNPTYNTKYQKSFPRRPGPTTYRKGNQDFQFSTDSPFKTTYGGDKPRRFSPRYPANQKFSKGQCTACKIYGHTIQDCRLIAPHIAMGNFVKNNPKICTEILSNHIASNTVEHKRTIVRTMQTMGILDEDADSDSFLDQEEIVDTPTVNRIISDESSCQDTDTTSSNEFHKVQINKISAQEGTVDILSMLDNLPSDTSPVTIQTIHDDDLNRRAYDADMYDGAVDTTDISTISPYPTTAVDHELGNLHLDDINCFIDTLLQKQTQTVKHFTTADLKAHVNQHWRLKIQVQMDSGASDCITPDKNLLKQFRHVKPRAIDTADATSTGCRIEGEGFLDLQTSTGDWLTVKALYVPNASGTIISPTFIALNAPHFTSWQQMSHTDTGQAQIIFFHRHEYRPHVKFNMYQLNNCWYLDQSYVDTIHRVKGRNNIVWASQEPNPTIHSVSKRAEYELWHQRLLHPGKTCMAHLNQCVEGLPPLKRHDFHTCPICQESKITHNYNHETTTTTPTKVGEIFSMDFGFVKGKIDNRLVRSHDGYSSYILIIDHKTRYTWVFLTKSKQPPTNMIKTFLKIYGLKHDGVKIVRTDQGGELANSTQFCKTVAECGYQVEITGADNSSQNGKAERPHRTLANMMRASLDNASLHPKYWSDALLHSAFIKNRLPHAAFRFKSTPYTELTGVKPNLQHLKVFGSRITVRKPGKRVGKISSHFYNGIFLRYAKTMRNYVYIDTSTRKIKTSSHAVFDEAHYSQSNRPRGAQILMEHGFSPQQMSEGVLINPRPPVKSVSNMTSVHSNNLLVQLTHPDAIIPKQASTKAAGYDLYSVQQTTIKPNCIARINTGVRLQLPMCTYGRIASRSGLVVKHSITTEGGVIDPDYTGEIQVILNNCGSDDFTIKVGDRIAQLILERFESPPITLTDNITNTTRGDNGFGSTGMGEIANDTQVHSLQACDLTMSMTEPYDILDIDVNSNHSHPTLGLHLDKNLKVLTCLSGTPAAKIKGWRTAIRNTTLYSVNDHRVTKLDDVPQYIDRTKPTTKFQFQTSFQPTIHPETGTTQITFDQFVTIAKHHQDIREADSSPTIVDVDSIDPTLSSKPTVNSLTRGKLIKQEDWKEWELAEKAQLDLYETQNMFSKPAKLPNEHGINVLAMIWVYLIKTCGRKKARCVANGNPRQKGSVTLANTYAACLEQAGARIFWATCALKNKVVYGADMSNAFAEAPAPKAPLYLKVDVAYKNWWFNKTGEQLDGDYYVKVQHAIQGHPESPRLWQLFIDTILTKIGFKATTHEPCVYRLPPEVFGEEIFLLRQVDDFALGCDSEETAEEIWKLIDAEMSAPLKREGLLRRFNGIDIDQTQDFLKVHCSTYISKIIEKKSFDLTITSNKPTPMTSDNDLIRQLDTAVGPTNDADKQALEKEMGFKYRNATGELLFAMVTCRPDISNAIIKLTQFNMNPARCHYEAIIRIYRYLNATKDHGLTFWRSSSISSLPKVSHHGPQSEEYDFQTTPEHDTASLPYVLVDSDWGGNVKTRRSISGIVIIMAGAAVVYKTILQRIVALSSTEAEFYALSEAGKLALYVRSILDELGMSQHLATAVYEDNKGCLHMTQNQKPTKNTRHVDLRHFAVVDWVTQDLLTVKKISTHDNSSDTLTKSLGRTLFYRHTDTIMGNRRPTYTLTS